MCTTHIIKLNEIYPWVKVQECKTYYPIKSQNTDHLCNPDRHTIFHLG